MRLLVLDTETTGLEPKEHKIIELAAAIYCTQTKEVLAQFGTIFYHDGNPCESINKISQVMLDFFKDKDRTSDIARLKSLTDMCDYIIAHNAPFDEGFCKADPQFPFLSEKRWVCSKADLVYPKQRSSRSLGHLAADHGIFNPGAHRAIHDVLTLCELLKHCENIETQIENSFKPKRIVVAKVSYDERHMAQEKGFAWNGKIKKWEKKFTEDELTEFIKTSPFPVEVIKVEG